MVSFAIKHKFSCTTQTHVTNVKNNLNPVHISISLGDNPCDYNSASEAKLTNKREKKF